MPLSWPNTPSILTSDELGLATPGQTTPFTFTVSEELIQVLWLTNIVLTDAVVGNRQFFINFFSETGTLYWQCFGLTVVPASTLEQMYYAQGDEQVALLAVASPLNIPAQFYMRRGWTMTFGDVFGISAGDLQFPRFEFDVLVPTSNAIPA